MPRKLVRIRTPKNENDPNWMQLLVWLADCEAATLEQLATYKSTSNSDLRRHQGICKKLDSILAGEYEELNVSPVEFVIGRLKDAIRKAQEKTDDRLKARKLSKGTTDN